MGDYTQADRAFRVDTPLGEDELLLEAFTGHEPISAPFRYTLELLSEDDAISPDDILEQPVCISLRLADDSERFFHGIVSRFVQLGKSEELTSYQAEVVPWLWFLSLSRDCKVFQQKSVIDIVEEVFSEYSNADYTNNCIQSYPPREYCVQYRESDLNFISRLLEEEGIYYYFEHTDQGHKLTLVDDTSVIEPCPVQSTYQVATTPEAWLEEDVIVEIQWEHLVNTGKVTLRDYDYLQPSNNLEASRGGEGGELYDYPGLYTDVSDGERYADIVLEEERADQQTLRGASTCRTLATGFSFDLERYYIDAANQTYMVVSARHTARGGGYRSGAPETVYRNKFECIPASIPYRPRHRARKPLVQGTQTAEVVGPSGEEIYTDEHGRVKIQFHWDRLGQKDENSSCWVRVSHPWAGKGWGSLAIPRIGQEVIVDFLEGNPDRPLITGRVYNQDLMPPFSPESGGVVSGVKSDTHKGSGFNEISMDDTAGEEKLNIHAQYDMSTTVLHDQSDTVKNNRTITVDGTHTETIKKDTTIKVTEGKQSNTVKNEIEVKSESSFVKIEAATQIELKCGASTLLMKSDGSIKLDGVSIAIDGKAKVAIHGAQVSSKADTMHEIAGAQVMSNGSATNIVKGGMVMLNP